MNVAFHRARRIQIVGLVLLAALGSLTSSAAQEPEPAAEPPTEAIRPDAETTEAPATPPAEPEAEPADPASEPTEPAEKPDAEALAAAALASEDPEPETADAETPLPDVSSEKVNLLEVMLNPKGRWLMLPIAAMSLLVVTFGIERVLGLRRSKILPPNLIDGLGKLASQKGGLDPRKAYRLCQQYPSTAAAVIRAMLLKVGRPHSELEHAVAEASEREAARLYVNVRWLSLAAGVTPLMGLLGTVWGMMNAFFVTANLPTGANKAQHLADGIYVALVTTFAGLAVAIPAAILAHAFEGRIQSLFRELDETLLGLLPQLERFEGRLRVSQDQLDGLASPAKSRSSDSGRTQAAAAPK